VKFIDRRTHSSQKEQVIMNERIRYPQVRVLDQDKKPLGIMPSSEALDIAYKSNMDLILISQQANPPVCRIMDYGKFKYEKTKSEGHKTRSVMKMLRLHPQTGEHDRNVLINHATKFLSAGHKVRVTCQFKGRENSYPEIGRSQLDKVVDALKELSTVDGQIVKQGRDMILNLSPLVGITKRKDV
jgi:translation initiation factor IF-3